jgi:hypothetical protein
MQSEKPIYRPRLVVDITEEQAQRLNRYLEYGMRSRVFSIIIDDTLDMIEKYGAQFLAAILARHLKLEDYTSLKMETKHGRLRKPSKKVSQPNDR